MALSFEARDIFCYFLNSFHASHEEINDDNHAEGLIGYVRERNYKGMTLESVVELENGKMVMVSEFFNEDDPDFDHSLDQKMAINWVESWEVVLADEEHK